MISFNESIADIARKVPLEQVNWTLMDKYDLALWIRRDDLLPTWCQGNKFYKLYHNLKQFIGGQLVVSFGGAFSNHLYALALASKQLNIPCVGFVRGERPINLSPTLKDVEAAGMRLHFVSRQDYRRLTAELSGQALLTEVAVFSGLDPAKVLLIPEGGANALGVAGCIDLGRDIAMRSTATFAQRKPFDDVLLPVGTGTTLAGLARGLPRDWQVSGVSVLGAAIKGERAWLTDSIGSHIGIESAARWRLFEGLELGGYARATPALLAFMDRFSEETGILLDQVYTGKLFWAIAQLAAKGIWRPGSRLLALHTGGLQGRRGLV